MDRLHFGELRQLAQLLADRLLLHRADGEVHPERRDGDDHEEQPEAALPHAGEIVQRAEGDGQDEAAEATHEAHHATHCADATGIIDRDVLVDRRLAEAHEETQHESRDDEAAEAHPRREAHRPTNAIHHVARRRIGQDEGADDRDQEGPVHDRPRTVFVGEVPAIGAENRSRMEYIAPIMPAVAISSP